jgi:hypothetical protein
MYSPRRNFFAISILGLLYFAAAMIFKTYNWHFQIITPLFISVVGYYLLSGPVIARSASLSLVPFLALPFMLITFPMEIAIGFVAIHSVLMGAFFGMLWGNINLFLSGKYTPRL